VRGVNPQASVTINERLNNGGNALMRLNNGGNPLIPTIWAIGDYETIEKLLSMRSGHRHDTVKAQQSTLMSGKKKNGQPAGLLFDKKDRWVKIKRIYKRLDDIFDEKKGEMEWTTLQQAAAYLDTSERGSMNLNMYSKYLQNGFDGKYSGKNTRLR